MSNGKLILFGAGKRGVQALKQYGKNNVACFCDNSEQKIGTVLEGVPVISFNEMISAYKNGAAIMITPDEYIYMQNQLTRAGVENFLRYHAIDEAYNMINQEKTEAEAENDRLLDRAVEQCRNWDLLQDITSFRELSRELLEKEMNNEISLYYSGKKTEMTFYGNAQAIAEFSGIPVGQFMKYGPMVCHTSGEDPAELLDYHSAVITFGSDLKEKIHHISPYVPVFNIAPYLYYSRGVYDSKIVAESKKKIGRLLVFFWPHTIERVEKNYDAKALVRQIHECYSRNYDSIWICAYWADVNDWALSCAETRGMHVVSAGFRFDSMFIRRLRTIFDFADAVSCADMGTHILYALQMGKPIGRLDCAIEYRDNRANALLHRNEITRTEEQQFNIWDFQRMFREKPTLNEEMWQWLAPYAGFDQVKTPEQLRTIFRICKDIMLLCKGNLRDYPAAVRTVYDRYDRSCDIEGMTVLKEAVGTFID